MLQLRRETNFCNFRVSYWGQPHAPSISTVHTSLLSCYPIRALTDRTLISYLSNSEHESYNLQPGRNHMSCSRCQGLMVREHFLDFDGTIGHMWANGYRCMNCGNVHDPIIEQHRLARSQQPLTIQHGEHEPGKTDLIPESQPVMLRAA